ncbi:MAG: ribonuclease J [Clostridia bacterium]|nr:ribonuclease J [Clostridia bacterium]
MPKTKGKKGKKPIRILFFGGVGEIGKNMTAIEYGNDIIVIDAGDTFPDEEMPGVDLVVPDASYLIERKDKIRAILLTHGHEDHIGGLAYLLKELLPRTPVYGTKLTLALADNKLREHRLQNVDFRTVTSGSTVKLGSLSVEFVNVNHSTAGAVALAIRTPYGIIYHSGDFKIDMTPVAGEPIDLNRISQLGKEGVLLYMGESTNIERPGYTMSETVVGTTLDHLFAEHASRRLVIATFASNVHRLQQIVDLAVKYKRRVALSGRSMLNVVEAASKIGELHIPDGILVDVEKVKNYFDREIVIVSTGSQGEPMSALTRMASGEFNKITIGENDTIIISASPIPGNEKMVYRVINNLYKKGATVVYESLEKIHVSGHACREEHKIIHTLLKPKFFIPVHGEYRHLKLHGDLAFSLGMPRSNIFLADIGNCVEITDTTLRQGESFPAGSMIIDGTGSEDFKTSEVIRDRKKLASEGVFVISVVVSGGVPVGEPNIENVGILFGDERDYEKEVKNVVMSAISQYDLQQGDSDGLSKAIVKMLKGYLYKKTKQAPLIVPVITEI